MTQIYETMVLLDNDVVRSDWKKAKAIVTDTVAKYDGSLETCRRWDERRLAYPMKTKNRATYYLAYHDMPGDKIPGFLRDLELNEQVLRYEVGPRHRDALLAAVLVVEVGTLNPTTSKPTLDQVKLAVEERVMGVGYPEAATGA